MPADSTILTSEEVRALADRAFLVRCAAEDIETAVGEGATAEELSQLTADLVVLAREAERLR